MQKLAAGHNRPGHFVSFLAYEWHSSQFGDYCLFYREDGKSLQYFGHVRGLQEYERSTQTTIIPHHLA